MTGTDAAAHEARGDELRRAKDLGGALDAYRAAAGQHEVPPSRVCAKLARVLLDTAEPEEAARWAVAAAESDGGYEPWTTAARVLDKVGRASLPPMRRSVRLAVVGTWTTTPWIPMLRLACTRLGIAAEIHETSFGQYFNETLDPSSALHAFAPDAVVLAPEHRSLGVSDLSDDPEAAAEAEASRWSSVWTPLRDTSSSRIVQHTFAPPGRDAFGDFGRGLPGSRRRLVQRVNDLLAERARDVGVGVVDCEALSARVGVDHWFDERAWYAAKVAVAPAAMPALARHTAAVLNAQLGLSRKCLVVDLDNVLWGGVVGDDGVDGLVLGEGPRGEAFVDLQRGLKDLSRRGVILAACSKNDEDAAMAPFERHPEMVLALDDFATFVANWKPKSENVKEIAARLDIGQDSLVFLDDNPFERDEVRRALPDVDVIVLPTDPAGYRAAVEDYLLFEPASLTEEDLARTQQYRARAAAAEVRSSAGSIGEYLESLQMEATIGPVDDVNLPRVAQLVNKTNQFNLTTIRRDAGELSALCADPDVVHFWVRLRDRFADHGLVAVVLAEVVRSELHIDTLLMSCRVIGRDLETVIVDHLVGEARARGLDAIVGRYRPTERNGLVADLFPRLGFAELSHDGDGGTDWILQPLDGDRAPQTVIEVRPTHARQESS